jgi:hypothetical protein
VRQKVLSRDGGRCVVCGTDQDLQIHHLAAAADGGSLAPSNLVVLVATTISRRRSVSRGGSLLLRKEESMDRGLIIMPRDDEEARRIISALEDLGVETHIVADTVEVGGDITKRPKLRCTFCGKKQQEVNRLIAGPATYICNECVDICVEIKRDD